MQVELLAITPNAEALIARCARISHRSEAQTSPEADAKLIRKLIELGHESVLEHASATFLIEGISRACMAQLTRHRLVAFTVESMRYVNVALNGVVVPDSVQPGVGWASEVFAEATEFARQAYEKLLDGGVPPEDARFVLPIGTQTRLVMTANFRELRHIIKLRGSKAAQWEIRGLAKKLLEVLQEEAPNVFGDLEVGQ